jgi:uridine kinase
MIRTFPKNASENALAFISAEEEQYRLQIEAAAEKIVFQKARFVFLAGPSCSGKTTTANLICQSLQKQNKRVISFSTDDFFFDQAKAPKNEDGTPNYDAFEHTDSALIIQTLNQFSRGEKAPLPSFDFLKGKRCDQAYIIDPKDYDVFILEGIHALNDAILEGLPKNENALCFYLNVENGVKAEGKNEGLLPLEMRFCRRLIRDFKHRGASADRTWALWQNVTASEKEILHPFIKNAVQIISTDFCYEPAVEKAELTLLLKTVEKQSPLFAEAKRILNILSDFPEWPEDLVPSNSVLREFID